MVRLLLIVLLALSLSAAQEAPSTTPCWTCAGDGRALLQCFHCGGDGLGPCAECTGNWWMDRTLAIMAITDPEEAQLLAQSQRELDEVLAQLAGITGAGSAMNRSLAGGWLGCPTFCHNGDSFLNPGHACKVCSGAGRLECRACKGKGEIKCFVCSGKQKLLVTCPECSGAGVVSRRVSRTSDAGSCPWCVDERLTECRLCDEDGRLKRTCSVCAGAGKRTCMKCAGTSKAACVKCSGTGDLSSFRGAGGSKRCGECRTKGVVRCDKCKSGRIKCGACEGTRRLKGACHSCMGSKLAPCIGCWQGSELAWVETAERLFSSEQVPEAIAHMQVAIERVRVRREGRLEAFVGDQKRRQVLKTELDQGLEALEQRLARMRE